ncbi:MAG TPA: hypothetical protein VGV90_00850 [Solirubrobacteraceae bacterium]|nr:hypothetical protein [Solirubrobacteraceae bacterium]
MKRPLIIAGILVLIAASFVVARWINNDTVERARVVDLLRAQMRGDAAEMLRRLEDCADPACADVVRDNARRLRRDAELKVALYQSQTAHALRSRTTYTRVVWFPAGREAETTVQCVLVRRDGNVFAGMTVSLLRVTAPIGRESSCPS